MDVYFDVNKMLLHIDDILEEKRTAQKLFDTIQDVERLTYENYNVNSDLVLKFQHLIKKTDNLVTYYSKLAEVMDETSFDARKVVLKIEQLLHDNCVHYEDYIDIDLS